MSYAPILIEPSIEPRNNSRDKFAVPSKKTSKARTSSVRNRNAKRRATDPIDSCPIIVHSHLRWDWVWQRPQQFVSRLSQRHPVLFIQTLAPDPQLAAPLSRFQTADAFPNLTILTLQFPSWRWPDAAFVDHERLRLVGEFLNGPGASRFERPLQWFYDPMTAPIFIGRMRECLTVYDCMDELSKFAGAPPEIVERERTLLAAADVVFTGGRKLFEAKSRLHPNCHFYGCGVDADHFGRALQPTTSVHPEVARLPKPVFGYFGVIDERLDYELLAELADAHPNGSLVMVGPIMKIREQDLPRRPNLHWLGQRAYADLPALCKGFDVCLMPFARNEATEYINPTKALEYMATGRPTVSTSIPDVIRNFGSVVQIARDRGQFISACQQAVRHPDRDAVERGLKMAAANSWESIVARLEQHIKEALRTKLAA